VIVRMRDRRRRTRRYARLAEDAFSEIERHRLPSRTGDCRRRANLHALSTAIGTPCSIDVERSAMPVRERRCGSSGIRHRRGAPLQPIGNGIKNEHGEIWWARFETVSRLEHGEGNGSCWAAKFLNSRYARRNTGYRGMVFARSARKEFVVSDVTPPLSFFVYHHRVKARLRQIPTGRSHNTKD
jgi:hypothetical protein